MPAARKRLSHNSLHYSLHTVIQPIHDIDELVGPTADAVNDTDIKDEEANWYNHVPRQCLQPLS
jgi:hypothetical protein